MEFVLTVNSASKDVRILSRFTVNGVSIVMIILSPCH